MARVKVDKEQMGRKVKLLNGDKEEIVKITQKYGYETESGTVIRPENLKILARSCRELEGDEEDSGSNRSKTKRKATKKKEPKTTRKTKAKKSKVKDDYDDEEDEKPSKQTKAKKTKVKKIPRKQKVETPLKKVNKITRAICTAVEAHVLENIPELLKGTGYDFKVAMVGGRFDEARLALEIGILPTNATEEDIIEYASDYSDTFQKDMEESDSDDDEDEDDEFEDFEEDEEDDDEETEDDEEEDEEDEEEDDDDFEDDEEEADEDEDSSDEDEDSSGDEEDEAAYIEMVVDQTTLSEDKATKYVSAWFEAFDEHIEPKLGDEVSIGTNLQHTKTDAIFYVVGWNASKGKVVLFDTETERLATSSLSGVCAMEILEDDDVDSTDDDLEDFEDEL